MFKSDLPDLLRWWLGLSLGAVALTWFTGYQPWPDALWFGVGFAVLGFSVVPLMWIYPPGWAGTDLLIDRKWRVIAVAFGWFLVTFPIGMVLAGAVWRLIGVEL